MIHEVEEFFPADYLQKISKQQFERIFAWLDKKRKVRAVLELAHSPGFSLLDAVNTVLAVQLDLEKRYPPPIPVETRILTALRENQLASRRVQAYLGIPAWEADDYVERVRKNNAIHLTRGQVEELIRIDAEGDAMGAVNRLRLYAPGLDSKTSYWFIYDLRKYYLETISGDLPTPIQRPIPKTGERYAVILLPQRKLSNAVETRIRQDYEEPQEREGIRKVFALLDEEQDETRLEATQMALLHRSHGNLQELLALLEEIESHPSEDPGRKPPGDTNG